MSARRELKRLRAAAILVSEILDDGERDPRWAETQELENAAIAYGRACRRLSESTETAGIRATRPPRGRSSRSRVDSTITTGRDKP